MPADIPSQLRLWFADRRRDLPWRVEDSRGLRDAYCTWISEVMLQQTRVEVVVPYFENFLQVFPNPRVLAAASEEEVLKAWAGLGYYRRARLLHAAAATLVAEFGGVFPETAVGLRVLPGVGAYTSAAIASLAFGERIPVVDGNVKRVVARFLALELAADDIKLERATRQQGEDWMSQLPCGELHAAGELNEAMMELGATVCLPRNPLCGSCPLAFCCQARESGVEADLPLPKKVRKWVNLELVFLVQRVGVRVLLTKRKGGWNPGMFEPPSLILQSASLHSSPKQAAMSLHSASEQEAHRLLHHGVARHTITHHRIRAHVFSLSEAEVGACCFPAEAQWLDPTTVPLTGLGVKVLKLAHCEVGQKSEKHDQM